MKIEPNNFGIYLHIPFCKQACHYCNYHFSTTLKKKGELVDAICQELILRKNELSGKVETIYFGGGTPSLLSEEELFKIFHTINSNYTISENPEITLEANPDDLFSSETDSAIKLKFLKNIGINRLSIGVQSFFENDLKWMNRAHNSDEALQSILEAKNYFENITIDLIYGIPGMSNERWRENLGKAFSLKVPHISCYALTVEPKTALEKFIETGKSQPVDDDAAQQHHEILIELTEAYGFDNYEFSNFGKPGFYSKNNLAYWEGKSYLGIGPSAHSYDGKSRSWNISNNIKYIQNIEKGILPSEKEILSTADKYNEYMMTRLRTSGGIHLEKVNELFGQEFLDYLEREAETALKAGNLIVENGFIKVSKKGKFLTDGLAGDLFWV